MPDFLPLALPAYFDKLRVNNSIILRLENLTQEIKKTVTRIDTLDDAIDIQAINRVLIIKLQHLGDVLLTTPLISVLKEQYPHLDIDVLVYQETQPVLEGNPYLRRVYSIDRNWKKKGLWFQLKHEANLLRNLKQNRYDLIINLTDRWRGAWLARILHPKFSVSRPYSHRRGRFWRKSFTHIFSIPPHNRHAVEINLDAIRRLGITVNDPAHKRLTFTVSAASEAKIDALLNTQIGPKTKTIVIHPTSRWMFKAWNPQNFAAVIDRLSELNFCIMLISGPAQPEIAYVSAILKSTDAKVINLAGQLNLNESAALIKRADCFLGLDSIAMHIAAAVNTPCVALFGPTNDNVWGPWMSPHQVLFTDLPCRPCGLKGCGNGMLSECIQAIRPDTVVQAILALSNATQA